MNTIQMVAAFFFFQKEDVLQIPKMSKVKLLKSRSKSNIINREYLLKT